jgi:NADH:ubiquinone oxidoreductase subunit 4 (subunit M)
LPGTLGFCSQDLLIHGTLLSHPLTGLLLPIATAMNAVSIFRLFTRLFLGKRRTGFTVMADALPRERWALSAGILFVVLGGLFPNAIVVRRSAEADIVEHAIQRSPDSRSLIETHDQFAWPKVGDVISLTNFWHHFGKKNL